ncbi:MAG TPA: response regulator [Polyangiaceae bacterium]|nr:response regulator [Polyangiaceae bacterium]
MEKATNTSKVGFENALVVDDCRQLTLELCELLSEFAVAVRTCETLAQARMAFRERVFDLVILDFSLPDGTALDLIDELNAIRPQPLVIGISGTAQLEQAFQLAQRGVRAFVSKPFDRRAIENAIDTVQSAPTDISPHVRSLVGHQPVKRVEELVRSSMLEEALARSSGNRRSAARLLHVSRQVLQHMLRRAT